MGAEGDVSTPQQRLRGLPAKSEQCRTGGQTTPPTPRSSLKCPAIKSVTRAAGTGMGRDGRIQEATFCGCRAARW